MTRVANPRCRKTFKTISTDTTDTQLVEAGPSPGNGDLSSNLAGMPLVDACGDGPEEELACRRVQMSKSSERLSRRSQCPVGRHVSLRCRY